MAKVLEDCWNNKVVPQERKIEFFKKLRDLCCLYGVHIGLKNCEISENELEEGDPKYIPSLFFEFYNGDTYYWDSQLDEDLEYSVYNTFINCENEKDIIGINGVSYQTEENE